MADPRERLAELAERVDRMVTAPDEVGGRLKQLVGRVYRLFGWQAKFDTEALRGLLAVNETGTELANESLERALDELADNVARAERAVVAHRYVPTAHASWLSRVIGVLSTIAESDASQDAARARAHLDPTRVLPPLTIETERKEAPDESELGDDDSAEAPRTSEEARLIELELAAIDHIAEAARAETRFLARRRRLLEGARRLLLDATAALPVEREGATQRERWIAQEITKLDRLEALGLSPRVALDRQAVQAARRGDRDRLYAALTAMDGFALAVGDRAASALTARALNFIPGVNVYREGSDARAGAEASLLRSATEAFGEQAIGAMARAREAARAQYATAGIDPELARLAAEYLSPGCEDASMSALVSVDGTFEVGGTLSPVRVAEMEEISTLVTHPTPEMLVVPARSVEDVPNAVIEDPRSIIMDLASGRLLARRFVARKQRSVERTRLVGEARIYVLDGSTSMLTDGLRGARARVRDAIMLAELGTMMRRLNEPGRNTRLSLFYRFFTMKLGPLVTVRTAREALAAMAEVAGTVREGGTNIQQAIVSSLELIRDAKRDDPDLARANIVLVTDGNAPIDGQAVRVAREGTQGVAVAISIIALGEENPVLRALAARQRARGERAFYHFMDDQRLWELVSGRLASVHAAKGLPLDDVSVRDRIEDVLLELSDLSAKRRFQSTQSDQSAGLSAQREAEDKNARALERRYFRWFPKVSEHRVDTIDELAGDAAALRIVLAAVADVVGELGSDELHRRADAIELLERLLPDARISPARYHEVLATEEVTMREALRAVHAAVSGVDVAFERRLKEAREGRSSGKTSNQRR